MNLAFCVCGATPALINPTLHGLFDKRILHKRVGGKNALLQAFKPQVKKTKSGMRIGVNQNFSKQNWF